MKEFSGRDYWVLNSIPGTTLKEPLITSKRLTDFKIHSAMAIDRGALLLV